MVVTHPIRGKSLQTQGQRTSEAKTLDLGCRRDTRKLGLPPSTKIISETEKVRVIRTK